MQNPQEAFLKPIVRFGKGFCSSAAAISEALSSLHRRGAKLECCLKSRSSPRYNLFSLILHLVLLTPLFLLICDP